MNDQACLVCGSPHPRAAVRLPEPLLFALAGEVLRQTGTVQTTRPPDQPGTCKNGHPRTAANVFTQRPTPNSGLSEACRLCRNANTRRYQALTRLGVV